MKQRTLSKLGRVGWIFGLVSILLLGSYASAAQAQGTTTIRISPAVKNLVLSGTGTVDVVIDNYNDPNPPGPSGQGLYGADVTVTFDQTKVSVPSGNVAVGPLLGSGTYFNVQNSANNSTGVIRFVITQVAPTPPQVCPSLPAPCTGVLFTITFSGNVLAVNSPVNITFQKLSNPNGLQIPATTTNGVINVVSPTAATVTKFGGVSAGANQARLNWETGTELNLLGFNVWRGDSAVSTYQKVNSALIAAKSPGTITGNEYAFVDAGVKAGKTYLYKLEVVKAGGASEWTDPVTVQVGQACAGKPAQTQLVSPANGVYVASNVTMDWTDVACAQGYRVELRRDISQARGAQSWLVATSNATVILEHGQTYYWRVRAVMRKRHSKWSEWSSFTVNELAERN